MCVHLSTLSVVPITSMQGALAAKSSRLHFKNRSATVSTGTGTKYSSIEVSSVVEVTNPAGPWNPAPRFASSWFRPIFESDDGQGNDKAETKATTQAETSNKGR